MKYFFEANLPILTLLLVLFLGHSSRVLAQPPNELLDRLRDRYESLEVLRATFTQRTTSPYGEELPLNRGNLLLQGDRYRVDTGIQTFVTNGETTWVYDAEQNQVLINDFVKDEATFSIADFIQRYDRDFEILESNTQTIDGERYEVIRMASLLDDAFFKEVTLTIRVEDAMITRLMVVDVNEATMDFGLSDIEINPTIEGDPFTFIPPSDAEIIDLRS